MVDFPAGSQGDSVPSGEAALVDPVEPSPPEDQFERTRRLAQAMIEASRTLTDAFSRLTEVCNEVEKIIREYDEEVSVDEDK